MTNKVKFFAARTSDRRLHTAAIDRAYDQIKREADRSRVRYVRAHRQRRGDDAGVQFTFRSDSGPAGQNQHGRNDDGSNAAEIVTAGTIARA